MLFPQLALILLLFVLFEPCGGTPEDPTLTFEQLYQFGKNSYTTKEWTDCVGFMRMALLDYRYYQEEIIHCRQECARKVEKGETDRISQFYAEAQRGLCLLRCKRDRFTEQRPALGKMSVYFDLMERKPYEYLHICYFKIGDLAHAVSSAYTFIVANPEHEDILHSLKFYMKQDGFKEEMLKDEMIHDYETHYMNGVRSYIEEDYTGCVTQLEHSLQKAIEQDNRCRSLCEDKIDWTLVDANPEIDVLRASISLSIVRCQHNCLWRLSRVNGREVGHLLAAHFEYLHFCYYQLRRTSDASRAVANYLLFQDTPFMRRNRYLYMNIHNQQQLFTPDQAMLEVHRQRTLEKRYLQFIDEKFRFVNNEYPAERIDDRLKMDDQVSVEDQFPYSSIKQLITVEECKTLAAPFKQSFVADLIKELELRVRRIYPTAEYSSHGCGETREADCSRALVLSIDKEDCSEWLGPSFSGCAVQFCD